ncbi:MAG TPA: DUF5671 domain-containing protein [Anaerolineales bacterium]|nr:DUF5671 domain-containing protein [Anaerolineales bacterium]
MRTVRRLFFYLVAFISLEVVLWGMIGLARSIVCKGTAVCGGAAILTQGLAAIIIGIPFFGIFWWVVQRDSVRDMDEHASGVRAVFLYAVLLGTLIPILQNFLALFDRLALQAVRLSPAQALFGPGQSWTDNLIAMVMNAIVAGYFLTVLRSDWQVISPKETFADVRRLYRHVWLLYSLILLVGAVQQLIRFILYFSPSTVAPLYRASGAHGVVLALVGAPLWYFCWKTIRDGLSEPAERQSLLRLGILYLLSLAGVTTVLSAGGVIVDLILRVIFGQAMTLGNFIQNISIPLSIGIPLAGIWAYYGSWLGRAITESPDAPRRAGMRRLYAYILSAIGLGATFVGLSLLLSFAVDAAIGKIVWADALRPRLAASLATLLVGLPLWWLAWRPMQADALSAGDSGDHARRSVLRKVYLYLALFVSVVGGMVTAVALVNMLLRSVFGSPVDNLLQQALNTLELLFLFIGLGVYHGLVLRGDGRMASLALSEKHAAFPVTVFDSGEDSFGPILLAALHKQTPRLPAQVLAASQPLPAGLAPRAVILPADLAMDPPEALRKWLGKYTGSRLVVPRLAPGIFWAGGFRPLPAAASQAAQTVRQLAEGQEIRQQNGPSAWMIVVYIIAGLFGLELLFGLIALAMSLLQG